MHPYVTKFWLPETYLTFRGGDKREEKKLLIKIKIKIKTKKKPRDGYMGIKKL